MAIEKAKNMAISQNYSAMIYGQAGCGKTALALSASNPVIFDFEDGIGRVDDIFIGDAMKVRMNDWGDVRRQLTTEVEDLVDCDTIIVDTAGRALESCISFLCAGRQPVLKDWSRINAEFGWFTSTLRNLKKDVIFICHAAAYTKGDDMAYKPDLREKSYHVILAGLDMLGYVDMISINGVQTRSICFAPTTLHEGKNTTGLPNEAIAIPEGTGAVMYWNRVVANSFRERRQAKMKAIHAFAEALERYMADIEAIQTADDANTFADKLAALPKTDSLRLRLRDPFGKRIKALGFTYDKTTNKYVA